MSRYREMQVFSAVVRAGSLASAAADIELSAATVVRTIDSLEARLNTTLLIRGPRGVIPTADGERFAISCQRILRAVTQAERSAANLHSDPAGRLTLAVPLSMANQVLTPIVLDYLAAFADVRIVIETREDLPRLLEEGVDIAFVVGHLQDSSGFAMPVGVVRPIVCGAPGYFARWGRPDVPVELDAHRTIVSTTTGHVGDWRFQQGQSHWSFKPTPVLNCTTRHAAIQAAACGLGLTRCMSHEAYEHLRGGFLETVLDGFAPADIPVHLVYREGRRAAARVRTFIDFAVPRLRAHPALKR